MFPDYILRAGAGVYQIYSGTSKWSFWWTLYDDPRDSSMIEYGNIESYIELFPEEIPEQIKNNKKTLDTIWVANVNGRYIGFDETNLDMLGEMEFYGFHFTFANSTNIVIYDSEKETVTVIRENPAIIREGRIAVNRDELVTVRFEDYLTEQEARILYENFSEYKQRLDARRRTIR